MISDQTTTFSNISLDGTPGQFRGSRVSSSGSALVGELWVGTSGLSAQGGIRSSGVTLDLRTNAVLISTHTLADPSTLTIGQLGIIFAASGMSLVFCSGKTVYTIGASAVSAAQA